MDLKREKIRDPKVKLFLNPEQWARTPLLVIPKTCLPKRSRRSSAFKKSIGVYVSYKEIYKDTNQIKNNEKLFFEEIIKFDFYDALQSLAKLHYMLSEGYYRRNPEELIYVDQLFTGVPRQRLENFWYMEGRKLFFRQQMLALIKTNIVKNDKKKSKKLVGSDLDSFGRFIFRVTDLAENDFFQKESKAASQEEKTKIRLGNLTRNLHFNSTQQFRYLLPRYWTIYFECIKEVEGLHPKEIFPIVHKFKKITGLNLELFIFLSFGLLAHYLRSDKSVLIKKPNEFLIGKQYFRNLKPNIREEAKKIFCILAHSKREFKIEDEKGSSFYFNFQPFWRRPFFKLNDSTYFLLDNEYLQEKATFGIYGVINDYLLEKIRGTRGEEKEATKRQRNILNAFTGRCFEVYVKSLLKRLYSSLSSRSLLTSRLFSEMEGNPTGGVDFIVHYPNSLIFIEVTISGIRHNTILKADLGRVDKEIQQMFFSAQNRKSKGKIVQLNDAINKFKGGELDKLGIDRRTIKKIYPVLVTEKAISYIPPIFERWRGWIQERKLLNGYLDDFELIDIEELEMSETLVSQGVTLPDIFNSYKQSEYKDWPFKNYLYFERKTEISQNQFLHSQLSKMLKITNEYFTKTAKTEDVKENKATANRTIK